MKRTNAIFYGINILAAALLGAGSAGAQTCVDAPDGLISFWPGDGDTNDVYSNFDATLAGGAGFAAGLVGDAFLLDDAVSGQADHVILPAQTVNGLDDLTIEFWVNTTDETQAAILSGANVISGGDNELLVFQPSQPVGLSMFVKQSSSGTLPVVVNDGRWHHVAFAREGEMGRLYVDGVLIDSLVFSVGPLHVSPGGLMLGQEQDCVGGCFDPGQSFAGLVDELAVYGRALSNDEIWTIVDAGGDGKCIPLPQPTVEELLVRIEELESEVDALTELVTTLEEEQCDNGSQRHRGRRHGKKHHDRSRHHGDDEHHDRSRHHGDDEHHDRSRHHNRSWR